MIEPDTRAEVRRLFFDAISNDRAVHEANYLTWAAESLTYRELFLLAVAELASTRQRLNGANHRLRQVMGVDPWHETETAM